MYQPQMNADKRRSNNSFKPSIHLATKRRKISLRISHLPHAYRRINHLSAYHFIDYAFLSPKPQRCAYGRNGDSNTHTVPLSGHSTSLRRVPFCGQKNPTSFHICVDLCPSAVQKITAQSIYHGAHGEARRRKNTPRPTLIPQRPLWLKNSSQTFFNHR